MDSIYLLNAKDTVILEHNWRGRSFRSVVDAFVKERIKKSSLYQDVPPVTIISGVLVFHVRTGNITILCTAAKEVDAAYVLNFIHRISFVFQEYFGPVTATTDLIQNNFDTVTELFCEMSDNGFPLTTESNGIRDVVLPPSLLNKLMNVAGMQSKYEGQGQLSSISWRRAKLKYTNNEIFVDVLEELFATADKSGKFVKTEIRGAVQCTTKLSGTPDVTAVLKPARVLQYPAFHPSVKREKYESIPGTLSFIPPDGLFTLMTYTTELDSNMSSPLPFSLQFVPGKNTESCDIVISTRANCPETLAVEVPLPAACRSVRLVSNHGECSIVRDTDPASPVLVRWLVKVQPSKTASSRFTLNMTGLLRGVQDITYARLVTTISSSAISGLKVDSLKMQRTGDWKPYKGVKYMTKVDVAFRAR